MAKKGKKINNQLVRAKEFLSVHLSFLVVLLAVIILGLWSQYNFRLIFVPRDEPAYQTDLSQSNAPKFDSKTIDKIQNLHDSGVQNPGTDYLHNRTNPFAE